MAETPLHGQPAAQRAIRRVAVFLEYLLMLAVLLACNSMYTYAVETVGRVDMALLFSRLSILLAALALGLRLWLNPRPLKRWLPHAAILAGLVVYAAAFYRLNARMQEDWKRESYILHFLLFLPLMTALFKAKQREGKGLDLLLKFSDIVCVLAALSLAVYIASVVKPDSVQADAIYTRWNNRRVTTLQINFLDVCQSVLRAKWALLNVVLLRNRSLFTEPLMFALPLLIALYTEMFLRDKNHRWRVFRWLLLTAAIITTSATIALMLMAMAWGLKGMSALLARGKRWLVIPILILAIAACGVLLVEKGRSSFAGTEVSSNSMGTHIDDYRASFRALAAKPLLGVGFLNEEGIFAYIHASRLDNPGLSNTAGTILAEGGLMLGALCMSPYLIWLLYLFRKRDWRVACWGAGIFGVYVGIIFKYHLLLMLLIAFGYSLLEIREGRLALVDTRSQQQDALPKGVQVRKKLPVPVLAAIVVLLNAGLALYGAPLWNALHTFLRGHAFSIGLMPLRSFCLAIALLLNGVTVRRAARGESAWARIAALVAWDALYLILYPALLSAVNTLLALLGMWGELKECTLLLAAWIIPAGCLLLIQPKRWLNRRGAILAGVVAAAIGVGVLGVNLYVGRCADAEDALVPELQDLVAHASGEVYVNDLPLLYHRQVKGIGLPSTRDSGFEVQDDVSIVFNERTERRELLEYGFQVARLSDGHLVYTNDEAVIDHLRERGTEVYRYYPFGCEVDLEELAELNGLTLTEDEALIVDGPVESLISGPYDTFFKGQYMAYYALHIDPTTYAELPGDTQVCRAALTWYYGEGSLASQPVTLDALDASGDAVIAVPFSASETIDGVEYQLVGEADFRIEIRSIEIRQTPAYTTITEYNSHHDVVRESYFNLDGTPHDMGGYSVLEQEFDMADRLIGQRFCDANGDPVLVRSGYAELRYTHNFQGAPNSESYLGTDGKPVMISGGYASRHWEYDAYGNMAVTRYYDTNGEPVNNASGYAVWKREFDDRRQVIRQEYFDTDGNPVEPAS